MGWHARERLERVAAAPYKAWPPPPSPSKVDFPPSHLQKRGNFSLTSTAARAHDGDTPGQSPLKPWMMARVASDSGRRYREPLSCGSPRSRILRPDAPSLIPDFDPVNSEPAPTPQKPSRSAERATLRRRSWTRAGRQVRAGLSWRVRPRPSLRASSDGGDGREPISRVERASRDVPTGGTTVPQGHRPQEEVVARQPPGQTTPTT